METLKSTLKAGSKTCAVQFAVAVIVFIGKRRTGNYLFITTAVSPIGTVISGTESANRFYGITVLYLIYLFTNTLPRNRQKLIVKKCIILYHIII